MALRNVEKLFFLLLRFILWLTQYEKSLISIFWHHPCKKTKQTKQNKKQTNTKNRVSHHGKGLWINVVFFSDLNLMGLKHDCCDTDWDLICWDLHSSFPGANVTSSWYTCSQNCSFCIRLALIHVTLKMMVWKCIQPQPTPIVFRNVISFRLTPDGLLRQKSSRVKRS